MVEVIAASPRVDVVLQSFNVVLSWVTVVEAPGCTVASPLATWLGAHL